MNTSAQKQEIGNQLAYMQCQKALKQLMQTLNLPLQKVREIDRRNAESFGVCVRFL
ncbi:MAG: hypothetical protein RR449_07255 [Christensenella sp.]